MSKPTFPMPSSSHVSRPAGFSPVGATGRLDSLRSQQFRHHGLRSQLAGSVTLRSGAHRCCVRSQV